MEEKKEEKNETQKRNFKNIYFLCYFIASSYDKEDSQVAMTVVGNGAYHTESNILYEKSEEKLLKNK